MVLIFEYPVTEITCDEPFEPKNGLIERSMTKFGGETVFSCNEGYVMEGVATLTCTMDGTWDNNPPKCAGLCIYTVIYSFKNVCFILLDKHNILLYTYFKIF